MAFLSFYKKPQPRGYNRQTFYVEDRTETSPDYFSITEFPQMVGGGRYIVKFKGNGLNLKTGSTIDVEMIDAAGQNMYVELLDYVDRFNNYYIMFEVYDITAQGSAIIYLVGEASVDQVGQRVPQSQQDRYNVRWQRSVAVAPFERNTADLIFDAPPNVDIVQVLVPERALVSQASASISGSNYSVFTSSVNDMTIVTSNFQGYDRDFASSTGILDTRIQSILLNPEQKPLTQNSVDSSTRATISDIQNGYLRNYTNRFGTIVKSANGSFRKDFLGGSFSFYDSASVPTVLAPTLPANYTVSGSVSDQLGTFTADIIEVLSNSEIRISKPLDVRILDSNSVQKQYTTTFQYKQATNFTASIAYLPNNPTYVTSSIVSQSFLEVSFYDIKPISGELYRLKAYYKRGIATGEYKQIYDHVVNPLEYLTDAAYPNQTTYAKREIDARLLGHFTEQSIIDTYWDTFVETPQQIYNAVSPQRSSGSLSDSIPLEADYTQSGLFATKFYQNYTADQIYTLGFNLALDPNTELEIYMGSDPLNISVSQPLAYTRAFLKDPNRELTRYSSAYNRFGKFVGKITNSSSTDKRYGRVEFDFETDADGLGRPTFRSRIVNETNTTGSAYLSEIGISPIAINGFNPNLIQFAIPFTNEITNILSLSQSLDFKIEYFDYTGKQSEYTTFINDLVVNFKAEIPSNTCQDEITLQLVSVGTPQEAY